MYLHPSCLPPLLQVLPLRRDNLQSSYGFIAHPVPACESQCVSTTASSNLSTSMFKQKRTWEISGTSLETVESDVSLRISAQTNLGIDTDTRSQMTNNMINSSEAHLHHHHHPRIFPSPCELDNSGTTLEAEEKMLKQKCRFE